jgi:hypothetical protein
MLRNLQYSFPYQLLLHHIKANQLLLLFWLLLFGIVSLDFARLFGIPFLFLDPEYMHNVSLGSMMIMGISLGIFCMAFHIASYILSSDRFKFLSMLTHPFLRFGFNNSIIPLAFIIVYTYRFIDFQTDSGLQTTEEIITELCGFYIGFGLVLLFTFSYFIITEKDVFQLLASNVDKKLRRNKIYRVNMMRRLSSARKNTYRVDNYLDFPFTFRSTHHFYPLDKELTYRVFDQNHLNASLFGFGGFSVFILLGLFAGKPYFQIPAGASIALLFAMIVMFAGAFSFWTKGWAWSILIISLLAFNALVKHDILSANYEAYGLNYDSPPADYSLERIRELSSDSLVQQDVVATTEILKNWRNKFPATQKPKLILICTSGGGQRAAMWTLRVLQSADSAVQGALMNQAMLITGASGGMIGAAYFRELYLQKQQDSLNNLYNAAWLDNIGKDLLNPVAYNLVVNDLFLKMQTFTYAGHTYYKDRGYAFEQQLNINTGLLMDKKLVDYKAAEQAAIIPMMFLAPTIVNDGRKLYLSPQAISYMNVVTNTTTDKLVIKKMRGIEFSRMFAEQGAADLSFLCALRMNATFPYITPNITLPSNPPMEVMDAGLTDNFGISDAVKFLYTFRKWISKNTSGVIIVRIRDTGSETAVDKYAGRSMFGKIFNPLGTLYNNWNNIQDNMHNSQLEYAREWFNGPIDMIDFQYVPVESNAAYLDSLKAVSDSLNIKFKHPRLERAALSWHLTTKEKASIKENIFEANNQNSMRKLGYLLYPDKVRPSFINEKNK